MSRRNWRSNMRLLATGSWKVHALTLIHLPCQTAAVSCRSRVGTQAVSGTSHGHCSLNDRIRFRIAIEENCCFVPRSVSAMAGSPNHTSLTVIVLVASRRRFAGIQEISAYPTLRSSRKTKLIPGSVSIQDYNLGSRINCCDPISMKAWLASDRHTISVHNRIATTNTINLRFGTTLGTRPCYSLFT